MDIRVVLVILSVLQVVLTRGPILTILLCVIGRVSYVMRTYNMGINRQLPYILEGVGLAWCLIGSLVFSGHLTISKLFFNLIACALSIMFQYYDSRENIYVEEDDND